MKIKLFVHVNNAQNFKVVEINDDHKIGHLVKDFAPELVHNQDFLEDVEVYLEDEDVDLDKGISVQEAGMKNGNHIFVGRCKKISVNINYAGRIFPTSVGPATSMKKLKKLSLEFFGIDPASGADLLLWFNNVPLDQRQQIGSLTDYPSTEVNLILATKNDVNGDLSHDLLREHLNLPEYQSGEIEGRWGHIIKENGPLWPVFFFWVSSSSGEVFHFKFDFSDYPNTAPTSVLWDMDNDCVLAPEKRPNNSRRKQQVFKHWGKECNYLPCDRLAFDGHPDWSGLHPALIWNSQVDTVLKYLNEVYQTLNS